MPCIYLKNTLCCFTSSCAAWIFGGSTYFILFWFIFCILVIMAIFNSLLSFKSNYNHCFLNTEIFIDIQIKQGNKIFSCHPNFECFPFSISLQYLCLKQNKLQQNPRKLCTKEWNTVFLFFLQCIFFPLISSLFPFFPPISAQATCLYSPLYDN